MADMNILCMKKRAGYQSVVMPAILTHLQTCLKRGQKKDKGGRKFWKTDRMKRSFTKKPRQIV